MRLRVCVLVAVLAVLGVKLRRGDSPASVEPVKLDAPVRIERMVATPTPTPTLETPELAESEDTDDEAPTIVVEKPLPAGRGNTIYGRMRDSETGELLAGVTVTASSPVLDGVQTAITDENGIYLIGDLPTGDYLVTVYYLQATLEHPHVWVSAMAAAVVEDDIDTGFHAAPAIIVDNTPLPGVGPNTVHGRMRDASTREALPGVSVIVTSPTLEQAQSAITDDDGYYRIVTVPPGVYTVTSYYLDQALVHPGVVIGPRSAVVSDDIDTRFARSKPITVTGDW